MYKEQLQEKDYDPILQFWGNAERKPTTFLHNKLVWFIHAYIV